MDDLLYDDLDFFVHEIVPWKFVLSTGYGDIILDIKKDTFKHLAVGSNPPDIARMSAQNFNKAIRHGDITMTDLFDEDDLEAGTLSHERENIRRKIVWFIPAFEALKYKKVDLYRAMSPNGSFVNLDYINLSWDIDDDMRVCLGIEGYRGSDFYFCKSLRIFESGGENRYLGRKVNVYKKRLVAHRHYHAEDFHPYNPRKLRGRPDTETSTKKQKTKQANRLKCQRKAINALLADKKLAIKPLKKNGWVNVIYTTRNTLLLSNLNIPAEHKSPEAVARFVYNEMVRRRS